MDPARKALILLTIIAFYGCTTLSQTSRNADPGVQLDATGTRTGATRQIDALELQSLVMGMADDYASQIAEIVYLLLKPVATNAQERILAQSYIRNSFGAAADIAVGPNPEVSLLDLLVLVSLQRATFERHWIPEVWGEERGGPSLGRLRELEANLWARSEFLLSAEQRATLLSLIESWLRDNPDRLVVALIRFKEFANARQLSSLEDRRAASGLLKEVSQAVGVIDDALLFGERALWYAGRLSYILGEQTELTAYRILSDPGIETFRESFRVAVETFETLPEFLSVQQAELLAGFAAEREAITKLSEGLKADVLTALDNLVQQIKTERQSTIDQFFTRLQVEREQLLIALETESVQLRSLMPEVHKTVTASAELARLTGESATTIDRIVARFDEPSSKDNQTGDSMAEIREMLMDASEVADRLAALLEHAEVLLQSPGWQKRMNEVDSLTASVIDRIFWRVALLVAAVFVGILVLRCVPRIIMKWIA